jgi:hypothetical protein
MAGQALVVQYGVFATQIASMWVGVGPSCCLENLSQEVKLLHHRQMPKSTCCVPLW